MNQQTVSEKNKKAFAGQFLCNLKTKFNNNKKLILLCFAATFIIGLAAHAYAFLNTNYSHDSLNAVFATQTELKWKIELGRFLVPLYQNLFRGRLAFPWLIGLLSLIFISLAVLLTVKMFNIKSRFAVIAVSGIMVSNITVIAQAGTYIHELDCNMLAMLFAVAAAYIWSRYSGIIGFIVSTLLVFASMGIYQSYVSVAIALIMFDTVIKLLNNNSFKRVVLKALSALCFVALALIFYHFASKAACEAAGVTLQARISLLLPSGEQGSALVTYWQLAKDAYKNFFEMLIDTDIYGKSITVIVASGCIVSLASLVYIIIKNREIKIINKIAAPFVVFLLPLGMNSIYVVSRGSVHDIMIYSIWLIFILFILLAYRLKEEFKTKQIVPNLAKSLSLILVILFVWQNIILSNTLYLKKDIEFKSTLSTMTRVVTVMEQHPDYVMGKTPVAFIGTANPYDTHEAFDRVKNITGAWANNSLDHDIHIYYYNTYSAYFDYVMNYPINICSDSQHAELKRDQRVKKMPKFPAQGSVEMIDGVMVVKLG